MHFLANVLFSVMPKKSKTKTKKVEPVPFYCYYKVNKQKVNYKVSYKVNTKLLKTNANVILKRGNAPNPLKKLIILASQTKKKEKRNLSRPDIVE